MPQNQAAFRPDRIRLRAAMFLNVEHLSHAPAWLAGGFCRGSFVCFVPRPRGRPNSSNRAHATYDLLQRADTRTGFSQDFRRAERFAAQPGFSGAHVPGRGRRDVGGRRPPPGTWLRKHRPPRGTRRLGVSRAQPRAEGQQEVQSDGRTPDHFPPQSLHSLLSISAVERLRDDFKNLHLHARATQTIAPVPRMTAVVDSITGQHATGNLRAARTNQSVSASAYKGSKGPVSSHTRRRMTMVEG